MKRAIAILISLSALAFVVYFTVSKWAIRHEPITFLDPSRDNRPVAVDIAVRRDKEMQANAGMIKLPVAIINHGNTVSFEEYSFLANVFAARGYEVVSIKHDLPTDRPMVTKIGVPYVERLAQIERGVANIKFVIAKMREVQPNADYDHLTVVGHSMGGEIAMSFVKQYPEEISKALILDNLRVPFTTSGKFDPGVLSNSDLANKAGITIVRPSHIDRFQATLDKFLADADIDRKLLVEPAKSTPSTITGSGAVSGAQASTANDDAACRERLRRRGVVTSGRCIELDAIVENLEKGRYHFNKPDKAYLGEPFELRLILQPLGLRLILQMSPTQDVKASFLGLIGPVETKPGQFGQSMEATLHGENLDIEPAGPQPRTATMSAPVEWSWNVTPQSGGQKTLTVDVAVNIQVKLDKKRVQLPSLHEIIVIQVSTFQRVKQYVAGAGEFVGAVAVVAPSLLTCWLFPACSPQRAVWVRNSETFSQPVPEHSSDHGENVNSRP